MKNSFVIVLVKPRDPNNIGAAARAMANFELSQLRVVDPYLPSWQNAVSAVGAQDILQKAKLFPSLAQALADCQTTVATTALKNRQLNEHIISLPNLPNWLEEQNVGKTAFVFGNEKTGLSNEDIKLCSAAMHIPTNAKQPSVNLAQAVILTCYELARNGVKKQVHLPSKMTFEQTEKIIESLEDLMQKAKLKSDYAAEQRKSLLRTLIHKSNLSKNELFFIKKFSNQIQITLKNVKNELKK